MLHNSTLPQIESEITGGHALWVVRTEYELIHGSLEIGFSTDPEARQPDRSIIFRNIMGFRDNRLGQEFEIRPGLLGIAVDGRVGATQYTITTDVNETVILTTEKPETIFH